MRVQRIVLPDGQGTSWTVLADDSEPVPPIEAWLAHLSNIRRSPNTQQAYATDLRDYFAFLTGRGRDWQHPTLELLGEWMAWLRSPRLGNGPTVASLHRRDARCGPATLSRKLSAVSAFYEFHARHGLNVGPFLTVWEHGARRGGSGSWKPFLTDVAATRQRRRTISVVCRTGNRGSGRPPRCRPCWMPVPTCGTGCF